MISHGVTKTIILEPLIYQNHRATKSESLNPLNCQNNWSLQQIIVCYYKNWSKIAQKYWTFWPKCHLELVDWELANFNNGIFDWLGDGPSQKVESNLTTLLIIFRRTQLIVIMKKKLFIPIIGFCHKQVGPRYLSSRWVGVDK